MTNKEDLVMNKVLDKTRLFHENLSGEMDSKWMERSLHLYAKLFKILIITIIKSITMISKI
jgi:hypothetical protein